MAACSTCSNLRPETMKTLSKGQRAVMFVDLKDLKPSATSPVPCPECALLWNALSLFKPVWEERDFNRSVELLICPGRPLRLNWSADGVQLELFEGFLGRGENYGDLDPRMSIFGPASYVSAHSGSRECFDLVSSWLEACVENHATCSPRSATALPTRLLDVGSILGDNLYLFETNGQVGRYIALSYCWGDYQKQSLVTNAQTIEKHKTQIDFHSLSQTLQDAVTITRALGVKYLWVDALCIIQGDKDDWARESARMASIYMNAYLTISADNSPGCDKGIFNQQTYGVSDQKVLYRDGNFVSVRKAFAQEHLLHSLAFREDNNAEPTRSRAWTLQETMLPNRILRYTSKELVWECNEGWYCECGGASGSKKDDWYTEAYIRNASALSALPTETIHEQWRQILACFTERSLTVETDRLPAISGLASQIASSLQLASGSSEPDTYLAGLWRSDLVRSLWWIVEDDTERTNVVSRLPYRRSKIWRAPSWSWAAIEGALTYSLLPKLTPCIGIIEASTEPSTVDKYGQVSDGKLILKGRVMRDLPLEIQKASDPGRQGGFVDGKRYAIQHNNDLRTFIPDSPEDWTDCNIGLNEVSLTCLLIGSCILEGISTAKKEEIFLVLRPKSASSSEVYGEVFERVGASIRAHHDTSLPTIGGKRKEGSKKLDVVHLFDSAPEEVITIV